jgi:hypothetical protein
MTCWCWWRSRSRSHGGEAAAELRLDGYGDVWRGLALPWLLPLYIGLGGSVGPPNTVHMTWGNPRDEWERNHEEEPENGRFSRPGPCDTGSQTGRLRPYGWSLNPMMSALKWPPFPHMNPIFFVLWLVELVWTRTTTLWS